MSSQQYLLVFLLTPAHGYDTSNNGVSRIPHVSFFVPCANGNYKRNELGRMSSAVVLEVHTIGDRTYVKPESVQGHPMFGGCFIYTSDSRFAKQYGNQPIHLYDRVE